MTEPGDMEPAAARLKALRAILVSQTDHNVNDFVGCDLDEIDNAEAALGVSLPAALRVFYATMGTKSGAIFNDSKSLLRHLRQNQSFARMLIDEEEGPPLPEGSIVISERYGEQFLMVLANDGSDPTVWRYFEGDEDYTSTGLSFLDLVESEARAVVATFHKTGSLRRHIDRLKD